jgi:aminotransferase
MLTTVSEWGRAAHPRLTGAAPFITPDAARFTRSVIRAMTLEADRCGAVNLSQGMPDFPVPDHVKEAAWRAVSGDGHQYSPPHGSRELREAVAEHAAWYLGLTADPEEEVTITCGGTEGMYAAVRSLTQPGDEVIIPSPYYENYWADCVLTGAVPRFVSLRPPHWRIDLDELADAFSNRTRLIVLCNPNNPTGTVYRRDELNAIAELCRRWGVVAVTDEIYEHIVYNGRLHHAIAALDGMWERTVTINSASKTFSVTGWRVGTVIAPPPITTVMRKVHDYLTICAPAPFQLAIADAYRGPRDYYTHLAADYQRRRSFLVNALTDAGFDCCQPEGAYYILVDIASFACDDHTFARRLLDEAGVACVPASCFFADANAGKSFIRFCFCKRDETLQRAAERLQRWRAAQR